MVILFCEAFFIWKDCNAERPIKRTDWFAFWRLVTKQDAPAIIWFHDERADIKDRVIPRPVGCGRCQFIEHFGRCVPAGLTR